MHLVRLRVTNLVLSNGLAATASTSGDFSCLKINTRSSFAGSGKIGNAIVSSQIFTKRAEKLVQLDHKKFQALAKFVILQTLVRLIYCALAFHPIQAFKKQDCDRLNECTC